MGVWSRCKFRFEFFMNTLMAMPVKFFLFCRAVPQIPLEGEEELFSVVKLVTAVITRTDWVSFPVRNGYLDLEAREGFCFVALIRRDGTWVTNGILQRICDRVEGLASSFNTATQILVIGQDFLLRWMMRGQAPDGP